MGQYFPEVPFAGEVFCAVYQSVDKAGDFEGRGRLIFLLPSVRRVKRQQLRQTRCYR